MKKTIFFIDRALPCLFLWVKKPTYLGTEELINRPKQILTFLFCILVLVSNAQQTAKKLSVGDKIPADFWTKKHEIYSQGKTEQEDLSKFKGRLVILDFWATWCAPCVAMMPNMENLQQEFDSRIQIVPVTYQDEQTITSWLPLQEKRIGMKFRLPKLVNDKDLSSMFPYKSIPHYVWIDRDGTVKAITSYEDVTSKNIDAILNDLGQKMENKNDVMLNFDRDKPLLIDGNGGKSEHLIYHSLLTSYIPGIHPGLNRKWDYPYGTKVLLRNLSIPQLFAASYPSFGLKNTIYNLSDSNLYIMPKGLQAYRWLEKYAYCYETVIPNELGANYEEAIRKDLHQMFPNYYTEIKKKRIKCLALVKTIKKNNLLKSKGGESIQGFNPFGFKLQNSTLDFLIMNLDFKYMQNEPKIIDRTGITYPIDLDIQADLKDVTSLNAALKTFGLALEERYERIDVLVIYDRNGGADRLRDLQRDEKK
ncbi:TlpA family protein disulfide reductase [Pedobacter roseus]|uniref:TlpA family protein disulfide reductase n=1 Tax=Pedobacter roseus TaxID=336820 RepID=A0A7G9QH85_9SPHI|nr:TlpA disulfide reductase family protein [Pedobacter roseus]QNN42710.1 TlpA family protein disulfide reductase [Pedobacter roseus]